MLLDKPDNLIYKIFLKDISCETFGRNSIRDPEEHNLPW